MTFSVSYAIMLYAAWARLLFPPLGTINKTLWFRKVLTRVARKVTHQKWCPILHTRISLKIFNISSKFPNKIRIFEHREIYKLIWLFLKLSKGPIVIRFTGFSEFWGAIFGATGVVVLKPTLGLCEYLHIPPYMYLHTLHITTYMHDAACSCPQTRNRNSATFCRSLQGRGLRGHFTVITKRNFRVRDDTLITQL